MIKLFLTIISAIAVNLISAEIYSWSHSFSEKIVSWASSRMPANLQLRLEEEWKGMLYETPGSLAKLAFACGCCIATLKTSKSLSIAPDLDSGFVSKQMLVVASNIAGNIKKSEYMEMDMDTQISYVKKRLGEIELSSEDNLVLDQGAFELYKHMLSDATEDRAREIKLTGLIPCRIAWVCGLIKLLCIKPKENDN